MNLAVKILPTVKAIPLTVALSHCLPMHQCTLHIPRLKHSQQSNLARYLSVECTSYETCSKPDITRQGMSNPQRPPMLCLPTQLNLKQNRAQTHLAGHQPVTFPRQLSPTSHMYHTILLATTKHAYMCMGRVRIHLQGKAIILTPCCLQIGSREG